MYLEHFQLKSQPFAEHAAVSSLWQDQRMDEGLARLDYLVQSGQLGLVTGPSGVGKSALLKRFLHGLLPPHCQALYCHLSHLPSAGLLKLVVTQLGESPRRGKERIYEQILERAARAEGTLLLVFDEAHLLDGDALTDLRLLISSALDVRPPLKMLLVGPGAAAGGPAAGPTCRPPESRLGPVSAPAPDPRTDLPLHRLPAQPSRRRRQAVRRLGQGSHPRLHRRRAAADQQPRHGLPAAGHRPQGPAD